MNRDKNQKYKQDQPTKSSVVFTKEYGSPITSDTSLQVSAFFRGVTYLASQIAKLPWNIKDLDNNHLGKRHDVYRLLNVKPNDDMSAFNFRFLMVLKCLMEGNAFAEIVRNKLGEIVSLIPIVNHDIFIVRDAEHNLFYEMSNTVTNDTVFLRPSEVLHFRNLHTEDGINGLSVINHAKKVLGIAAGADRMAGSLYANSGLPSGTLKTERVLGEDTIERLKKDWKNKFGGNKAGGIAVLEEGLSFDPITMAPDVLQFLESRHFSVLEIARFLGVPPSKLYVIEAQSYNNIESSNLEVSNDTLDPWARNFEGEVDIKLLDPEEQKSELDLYQVSRGDMETRGKYFGDMVSNGAMTPNQVREKEGEPRYDGGDEYYIASNNLTPISRQNEVIDSQIASKNNKDEKELNSALAKKLSKR